MGCCGEMGGVSGSGGSQGADPVDSAGGANLQDVVTAFLQALGGATQDGGGGGPASSGAVQPIEFS
jgi:hypothetical protein